MTAMSLFAGIDTGVTGAIGVLDREGEFFAVLDLPVIQDGKLAWIDAEALLGMLAEVQAGRSMQVYVERTHAMPGNGSQAAFSQGCTLGSVLATLQAARLPTVLVSPAVWKRHAGLSADKSAALDRARISWPAASLDRKRDHNRAEALLIARFGQRTRLETVTVQIKGASCSSRS